VGVSVSAAVAIIFSGFLVSASIFFAVFDSTVSKVLDSSNRTYDDMYERAHTTIAIKNATYDHTTLTLSLDIMNTGSTGIDARATQVILDGVLRTSCVDWNLTIIDGVSSHVWAPKTMLSLELKQLTYPQGEGPQRVKAVTGNGISDYTTDVYIPP